MVHGTDHTNSYEYLVKWSMSGGIFLTVYELIQFIAEGPKKYIYSDEIWNKVDILLLGSYWYFYYDQMKFFNDKSKTDITAGQIYLRIGMILLMLLKLNFFMRIIEQFGLLVNLLKTCLYDILPFTIYLGIWLACFYLLYQQSGIESPERPTLGNNKVM